MEVKERDGNTGRNKAEEDNKRSPQERALGEE